MEEYITKRTKICRACPICDQENEICNAHLYLNPENNDVSTTPKKGYLKGCGCPKCGLERQNDATRLTTEEFIIRANKIQGNKLLDIIKESDNRN